MNVIICGGRDFDDYIGAYRVLDDIHSQSPISHVIEGGARGADAIGRAWAIRQSIPYTTVHANWNQHGKRAGWIRNNAMADLNPDAVIAFPGGDGTAMMVRIANSRNIPVIEA